MSCNDCKVLEQDIRSPPELEHAIQIAANATNAGTLKYEGADAYSDPFALLARGEAWGDIVTNYFSCNACGQWLVLSAETYHGSGGAFRPSNDRPTSLQGDSYPL